MANNVITSVELADMVRHWLRTPPNGYLGSGYGSDIHSLLQKPMTAGLGDALIAKMIEDIPLLGQLPNGTVNVYLQRVPGSNDQTELLIEVADQYITISGQENLR